MNNVLRHLTNWRPQQLRVFVTKLHDVVQARYQSKEILHPQRRMINVKSPSTSGQDSRAYGKTTTTTHKYVRHIAPMHQNTITSTNSYSTNKWREEAWPGEDEVHHQNDEREKEVVIKPIDRVAVPSGSSEFCTGALPGSQKTSRSSIELIMYNCI